MTQRSTQHSRRETRFEVPVAAVPCAVPCGWRQAVVCLALAVSATACAADDVCTRDPSAMTVVPVQGIAPHTPLAENNTMLVEWGPQGGFHIYLAVHAAELEPGSPDLVTGLSNDDLPTVYWELRAPDGLLSADTPHVAVAQSHGDGWLLGPQLLALQYYENPPGDFDPAAREAELEAATLELQVEVEDMCGARANATIDVRIDFPVQAVSPTSVH